MGLFSDKIVMMPSQADEADEHPREDDICLKRIAQLEVLGHGISTIAGMLGVHVDKVSQARQTQEYKTLLQEVHKNPKNILPSHTEVYAWIAQIAQHGKRDADRLKAIQTLLEVLGEPEQKHALSTLAAKPTNRRVG